MGALAGFFGIAFAVMWVLFTTVAVAVPAGTALGQALILAGAAAPAIAALAMTAVTDGRAGVRGLLARLFLRSTAARWYLFAVAYMAAVKLTVAILHRAILGAWPVFGGPPLLVIPLTIAMSTPFQAGEEIGWRGYALPRLASRLGLAPASILLGLVWGVWHLPQFFIADVDTYGQSFAVFVLQVTAISVAMAWLFVRADGCLLPVMVMHAAVNNTKDIVPSAVGGAHDVFGLRSSAVGWLTVAVLWILAAGLLPAMRSAGLSTHTGDGQ
jgi:CAAX protease family protein